MSIKVNQIIKIDIKVRSRCLTTNSNKLRYLDDEEIN